MVLLWVLNIKIFKHTRSPGKPACVPPEFWASRTQRCVFQSPSLSVSPSVSHPLGKRTLELWLTSASRSCLFLRVNEGLWACEHSCCQRGEKQDVTQLDLSPNLDTHSEPFPCQRQHKTSGTPPGSGYMLPPSSLLLPLQFMHRSSTTTFWLIYFFFFLHR